MHFKDAESFLHSELEWDAVIRELEIIGEATKYLLKEDFIDSQYQIIVDFRNQIAHGYFSIDENIVWEVVKTLLNEFIKELVNLVKQNRLELRSAVENAKKDYHFSKETMAYLNTVK